MKWICRYTDSAKGSFTELAARDAEAAVSLVRRYTKTGQPPAVRVSADPRGVLRLHAPPILVFVQLESRSGTVIVLHACRTDG